MAKIVHQGLVCESFELPGASIKETKGQKPNWTLYAGANKQKQGPGMTGPISGKDRG